MHERAAQQLLAASELSGSRALACVYLPEDYIRGLQDEVRALARCSMRGVLPEHA